MGVLCGTVLLSVHGPCDGYIGVYTWDPRAHHACKSWPLTPQKEGPEIWTMFEVGGPLLLLTLLTAPHLISLKINGPFCGVGGVGEVSVFLYSFEMK